jgi:DNA-directed RNA polymerase specialized sigma subunit
MTKEQLQKYVYLEKLIDRYYTELAEVRSRAEKMTRVITGMPRATPMPDHIGAIVAKMERIKQRIAACVARQEAIENAVETLPEREQHLIRERYLRGKSWDDIAKAMNYSHKHLHRIHSAALQMLAAVE